MPNLNQAQTFLVPLGTMGREGGDALHLVEGLSMKMWIALSTHLGEEGFSAGYCLRPRVWPAPSSQAQKGHVKVTPGKEGTCCLFYFPENIRRCLVD